MHTKFLVSYPEGNHSDMCVDKRVILKWIIRNSFGRVWIGFIWVSIGTGRPMLLTTFVSERKFMVSCATINFS